MLKKLILIASFCAGAVSAPMLNAGDTYAFDIGGAHASINFKFDHLGFSFIVGRFDKFDGQFVLDEENLENSSVTVTIETASLNTNHNKRDDHLRGEDFLHVEKHPKATFVSTNVSETGDKTMDVTGDFTFMGQTKPMTLNVTYIGGGKDPWGGFRQGFEAAGSFNTGGYGMPYPKAADMQVELMIHVEGKRKD